MKGLLFLLTINLKFLVLSTLQSWLRVNSESLCWMETATIKVAHKYGLKAQKSLTKT